ncbi:MAG TPA: ThiF family adenylyltransferase [Mycobacterium sp.]|nr:ThiF family adenylyltransferase [Mycobacterium sp.]
MMRLSPAMTWSRHGHDIFVHGERQVLKLSNCAPEVDVLMRLLEAGCDAGAVDAIRLEPAHAAKILEWLRTANCLVENDSQLWMGTPAERQADYFSALGANPDEAQVIIGSVHVALLGVGGIGTVVLAHLVSAGVNRYTLIDGDIVQSHNLNRQFIYGPADVGRSKVDTAADWIGSRNPSADVRREPRMLTGRADLISVLSQDITLLVVAADSPSDIGLHAAYACLETDTTLIGADCGLRTASWGPLLEPADIPAYVAELESARAALPVPPATRPMTASFGPTNAIAASYLAKDILHWLAGLPVASHRRKVVIDIGSGTIDAQGAGLRARTENA